MKEKIAQTDSNTEKKSHGCSGSSSGGCCQGGGGCGSGDSLELNQWPIQLHLVDLESSDFKEADLVISADCAPFAYPKFHERFLKGKKLLTLCPKSDIDQESYVEKLTRLFKTQNIRSVTLVRMEASCCSGIEQAVEKALGDSGVNVLIKEYIISSKGEIV
ncbi:MAG: hypothetical protein WCJ57_02475 [Candidatus Falkowbacteria bacterium]